MIRLLSILSVILAIVLFPPATLAVISNNAIPGDSTYPIKRGLEDVIFAIASLNPTTQAWFSAARSDRRFKELNVLITQGKQAKQTLTELVEQTSVAAGQIAQIQDPGQKQQLIEQYTQTIEKYNQGLTELAQNSTPALQTVAQAQPTEGSKVTEVTSTQITQTTQTTTFTATSKPTTRPTSSPTSKPTPTSVSTPTTIPVGSIVPTSIPSSTPRSTTQAVSSSTPNPTPTISQSTSGLTDKQDIENAIDELKKIQDKLHSNLTPKVNTDKIKKKGNEGASYPGAGDDESSRQQRNSLNEAKVEKQ